MSDWGWHQFPNSKSLTPAETEKSFNFGHGHQEVYAIEYKKAEDGRHKEATEFFRVNPHRLNLGAIGLQLTNVHGKPISQNQLTQIRQEQKLLDGEIESSFWVDGQKVEVTTGVHPTKDALYARIVSKLLKDQRATIHMRFPYPTGKHADDASNWNQPAKHQSEIIEQGEQKALIKRTLDATTYYVLLQWEGQAMLDRCDTHDFELTADDEVLTVSAEYLPQPSEAENFEYDQYHKATLRHWNSWWNTGAMVDFSQCTDPRAKELERRVILSQYLTQINCANNMPPQETGLTYNSWFGRPHLEMTWISHIISHSSWPIGSMDSRLLTSGAHAREKPAMPSGTISLPNYPPCQKKTIFIQPVFQ